MVFFVVVGMLRMLVLFLFFETFAGFPARPRSAGNGKTLAPFTLRSGEIPRRRGAAPVNSGAYVWPLSSVKLFLFDIVPAR